MTRWPKPETICGWLIGASGSSPRKRAHPGDAVALDDVVGVDHVLDPGNGGHVAADDDGRPAARISRTMRHISRTLPTLTMIDEMPTMSYWLSRSSFAKASRVGKSSTVEGAEIFSWIIMNAPRAVEHAQGERALLARHLVVVQLHRVDGAAAELIVLRVGTEDGSEQDTGLAALGVLDHLNSDRLVR